MEFRLLIVDDAPDSFDQAVEVLREFLDEKGFTLSKEIVEEFSEESVRSLAWLEGRNYDLAVVDYNLGETGINGAEVAARLRSGLRYTDMVFYSSDTRHNLHRILAEEGVSGAFVVNREELDEALVGVAETVIGKVADLSHLRGVAMAEVADMDLVMEETLELVLESGDDRYAGSAERTEGRLQRAAEEHRRKLEARLREGGLLAVIQDGRLFSAVQRFWALRSFAKEAGEAARSALNGLADYQGEVLEERNRLAHARERVDEEGETRLEWKRGEEAVTIDEEWMAGFRVRLREYRVALDQVCELLRGSVTEED